MMALLLVSAQARHINNAGILTLPDFYARKYGKLFEVLVSLTLCTSFISLLAGNFVGEHAAALQAQHLRYLCSSALQLL
jgi:Na+/proline symporter